MQKSLKPDYIFETSWEVCNLVGGIYTVLSTRAATLYKQFGDRLIFVGADISTDGKNPLFEEDTALFAEWKNFTQEKYGLKIRVGRWLVPSRPVAVLVDFQPLFERKNEIYGEMWEVVGVNSIEAYGDYDECSMFGYAAGMIVESFYHFLSPLVKGTARGTSAGVKVIAHFNEWQTAFGVFYLKKNLPAVATVFTTHATSIGRSIAGNNKPLYDYFTEYNGDQMAHELNVVSKHSAEKCAAHTADCFTTVSEITARECAQLLECQPDVVTPNGFEDDFVPKGHEFTKRRNESRALLRRVAETLFGYKVADDALFVGTAGRYEYKNKGLDVLLESLKILAEKHPQREVLAFIVIPAWVRQAREDLSECLKNNTALVSENYITTHELVDAEHDSIMQAIRWFHFRNAQNEKVKIVYVPSYLDGFDGIFNKPYYDILIGMDLTVFPSYYEPWGYTPLESIAFSVPTLTTDLSGFGQWIAEQTQGEAMETGVGIIHRSDYNSYEVAAKIAEKILYILQLSENEMLNLRHAAKKMSERALWKHFIKHYFQAYDVALRKK